MAGMFYSFQEAREKLNLTEEQLKELVSQGRLREFRDGANILFKVDEVESLMADTAVMAPQEVSAEPEPKAGEQEIPLELESAEDTAAAGEPTDEAAGLTDADTAIVDEGISVLGETDSGFKLPGDTKAAAEGTAGEASLEEIEESVNLDTFGSGSGLLDLSLQADDTSLGGILDEIYTPEGDQGQEPAPEAESAVDVDAEAEEMLSDEDFVPQPSTLEAPAVVRRYAEPVPDTLSNALGIMLFLPLVVIVYTAIVTVAGFNNLMPAVLEKIQGIIWYILIGVGLLAALIVGGSFMAASKGRPAATKKATKKKAPKKPKSRKARK